MQFPQDGGLSCVRYHLASRDEALEEYVCARMESKARHVGRLICQCGAEDQWEVCTFSDGPLAILECGCNGSSLPVYIGKPPFEKGRTVEPEPNYSNGTVHPCNCGEEWHHQISIGIGYPSAIPKLGTLDVERAQEVLIASRCLGCNNKRSRWHLSLPEPPLIIGDEPWIRIIQGLGYGPKSRWEFRP